MAADVESPLACPHRPPCPGCPRFGAEGLDPECLAALRRFAEGQGVAPPRVVTGAALGQRHRARLAVRGRARSPKVGLFQEGTHRIVDVPRCATHHPRINEVAAALKHAVRETGVPPYADRPHVGVLRSVQVVVERRSGGAQVVLVCNEPEPDAVRPLVAPLHDALGPRLHSLWWNGNPERTNRILGPAWQRLAGPATVRETLGGCAVHFPPGAFGQSHLPLAARLVERVHAWVPEATRVVEYHAGVGATGLGLLARGASVSFNERDPDGLAGLEAGLAELPNATRARARVLPGAAGDHVAALAASDVAIVDPPRRGLESPLLDALCAAPPSALVYVSCDPERFLEEAARLVAGPLRLRALEAWGLFPYTRHVEAVAHFTR